VQCMKATTSWVKSMVKAHSAGQMVLHIRANLSTIT
jgi:hypothetical protein